MRLLLVLTIVVFGGEAGAQDLARLADLVTPAYTALQYSVLCQKERGWFKAQPAAARGTASDYVSHIEDEVSAVLNAGDAQEVRRSASLRAAADTEYAIREYIAGKETAGEAAGMPIWCLGPANAFIARFLKDHDEAHAAFLEQIERASSGPRIGLLDARPARHKEDHLGSAVLSRADGISAEELRELVSIVYQEGASVNFHLLCAALELLQRTPDCVFRQISVRLDTGKGDVLAFNVPDDGSGGVSFVLIFHVARDLGEIYVVSMAGGLKRAYVQRANGRFVKVVGDKAEESFRIDVAYWARNLPRVYDDLGLVKPAHRR